MQTIIKLRSFGNRPGKKNRLRGDEACDQWRRRA
jgi:hypothetical protein